MNCLRFKLIVSIVVCFGAARALAEPAQALKSEFNVFNPTPRELMRELSTDRPDITESPYTVDAGHVQLEMSFVEYVRDGSADEFIWVPINLKLGVLNTVDLQMVFEPYVSRSDGENADGIGPTQLRVKINLWGNDGGPNAMAIMPFIKLPTEDDDIGNQEVEGGLIFAFATELSDGWSLGMMAEFDAVFDESDDGYDLDFVHSAAAGHDLCDRLGGYIEYIGIMGSDSDIDYRAFAGAGLTYALSDDVQLDAGINFGLTAAADDFNPFVGLSIRF